MKAWLDATLLRCPNCGHYYVDSSWYVMEMESDIQCGHCGKEFNSRKNADDRVMLEFEVDNRGKMSEVKILEHLQLK